VEKFIDPASLRLLQFPHSSPFPSPLLSFSLLPVPFKPELLAIPIFIFTYAEDVISTHMWSLNV
jgi:hypothetical protein